MTKNRGCVLTAEWGVEEMKDFLRLMWSEAENESQNYARAGEVVVVAWVPWLKKTRWMEIKR